MRLFLRSGGRANTLKRRRLAGRSTRPAAGSRPITSSTTPPTQSRRAAGRNLGGIVTLFDVGVQDQRAVESRGDVLVYTSDPLERDTEVTGYVTLDLWAATSADDADWTAKLVDVHPDGRALNVCDGILRASCRDSLESPSPVAAGEPHHCRIDVGPTAMLFRAGHSIRLEVSSSNFPAYARQTGSPHHKSADLTPSTQTILHDADHPSALELPVVRR